MASYTISNGPENVPMDEFFAKSGKLAKSCRFMVRIAGPKTPNPSLRISQGLSSTSDLSFLCEAAEFPGRGFMSADIRYYGPNFKVPYQTTYEDLTLTFMCRDEFLERQYFDSWMELINPQSGYDFSYRDDYVSEIEIFQLSELKNKAEYAFKFEQAYPVLVAPQPVTWADDNFHRLSITFTYLRWFRYDEDKVRRNVTFQLIDGNSSQTYIGGTYIPNIFGNLT